MRYFIELKFDGTNYHGWQNQPDAVSVQEVLEDALGKLLSDSISITGAGRTDAGVHSLKMFAHFESNDLIDKENLLYRLNSFLPNDIAINSIRTVGDDAHARFDAVSRSYIYKIHQKKNPFLKNRSYYLHQDLDVETMNKAGDILLQYKDFECFSKTNTDVKTFICHISKAHWTKKDESLEFVITADRFLRNMVRAIVGTMIDIGLHKIQLDDLHYIIESKNRSKAGYSVPAHGLYLSEVVYPEGIFINEKHS